MAIDLETLAVGDIVVCRRQTDAGKPFIALVAQVVHPPLPGNDAYKCVILCNNDEWWDDQSILEVGICELCHVESDTPEAVRALTIIAKRALLAGSNTRGD